jgi:hypothetical protein
MACNNDTPSLEINGDAGGDITSNDTGTGITSTFELIPLKLDLCDNPAFSTMLDLVEKRAAAIFGQKPPPTKDAVGTDRFNYRMANTATNMDLAPFTRAAQLECWREAILLLNLKSTRRSEN